MTTMRWVFAGISAAMLGGCASVPSNAWDMAQGPMLPFIQTALNKATPTSNAVEPWTLGPNSYHGTVETVGYYDTGIASIRCYDVRLTLIAGEATDVRWAIGCAPAGARGWSVVFGAPYSPRPNSNDIAQVATRVANAQR